MNKVGECYLPNIVHRLYFGTIFNGKMCTLYSIKYGILKGISGDITSMPSK
jgi:hypothetical protein